MVPQGRGILLGHTVVHQLPPSVLTRFPTKAVHFACRLCFHSIDINSQEYVHLPVFVPLSHLSVKNIFHSCFKRGGGSLVSLR